MYKIPAAYTAGIIAVGKVAAILNVHKVSVYLCIIGHEEAIIFDKTQGMTVIMLLFTLMLTFLEIWKSFSRIRF